MKRLDAAVLHRRRLEYHHLRRSGVVDSAEARHPGRSSNFPSADSDFFEGTRWDDGWEFQHDFTAKGFWDIGSQLADALSNPSGKGPIGTRWPRTQVPATGPEPAVGRQDVKDADATDRVLAWAQTFVSHPVAIAQELARDEPQRRAALRLLTGRQALTRAAWVVTVLTYPVWTRPLSTLSAKRHGHDYFEQLLGRLPVAGIVGRWLHESIGDLSDVWYMPHIKAKSALALVWFVSRSQGASLTRVTRGLGWWPTSTPMVDAVEAGHWLDDQGYDRLSIGSQAVLAAAVAAGGGTDVEYRRLRNARVVADYDGAARFAVSSARWLARHRAELTDDDAESIAAWARHMDLELGRDGRSGFSWKGRTPVSALSAAREYEGQIELSHQGENLAWDTKGWDAEVVDASSSGAPWVIKELLSSRELVEEGTAQRHCVGSYALRCVRGESAIFQVSRDGVRCATIEVLPALRQVVQSRGRFNAAVPGHVDAVIRLWSEEMGLTWCAP